MRVPGQVMMFSLLLACPMLAAPGANAMGANASSIASARATVGAYYFDGWAGSSDRWRDDPAWTRLHPPTHLTKRMLEEFADREPVWGWRDDKLEIMERQIDLAADHGIAFFAFCWYWNMPTLSVGWDKRPWEGDRGLGQPPGWHFPDRTPAQFAKALESAIAWTEQHPDQTTAERIVLLYAWNEFGEGGYLAPTKGDPEGAYLKAMKQVLGRPASGDRKAHRILFLGNSITLHGPNAEIGWPNNWGMAASAEEKDYVHVLTNSLAKLLGRQPEIRVKNVADFERHYETYDAEAGLKGDLDFSPDTVVVAIGENVPPLASEDAKAKFKASFVRLLTTLKSRGKPAIFVRSCFWPDKAKDDVLREAAVATGGVFVDISGLSKDESNYARSERKFAHAGVAGHPGDQGMKAIAQALLQAMTDRVREQPR
jgi:hypothetical protein